MAQQDINVGSAANDRSGDSIRAAFQKINANFTELYSALGLDEAPLNLGAFEFTGSTITTTDSSAVVIDQAVTVTSDLTVGGDILPSVAQGGDLGSLERPWKSLYVSDNTIFIGSTAVAIDDSGNLTVDGAAVNAVGSADWSAITNKPIFASVATSGSYVDLSNKPTIPADVSDLTDNTNLLSGGGSTTNIESENDVSIRINLTDSTAHIWRFGEDGELTLAGPITNLRTNEGKIALGFESGLTNQGGGTVAVGQYSGRLNQGGGGVAVGGLAGNTDQGASAVAVGSLAGGTNQGVAAVAVGALAGGEDQGQGAVAVGQLAGGLRQGEFAIAIGTSAGVTDQPANSIVLNASGLQLNGSAAGFYVDPIRNIESGAFLNYNTSTKELGWSNDISSEGDISVNINLSDSTQRTWRFGEDGDLTFPNGQQIAAEDPNILLIGSPDAGLILNSQTQSSRLIAKKTFDREFNDNPDYTFSATVGPPHTITVTFGTDTGLYLLELLSRLASKFNGVTDFRFDYSNIRIVINPYAEAISANILAVGDTSGTTWDITIDQDPTAVVGNVTDIQILYDYNNTIGLDVGEDMFGIATDNDDIDIRSGRDIDLIAADDMTFRAGSTFDLTLLQNDDQASFDGLEIITESSTQTNIWNFRFDGHLHIPGNIIGTNGISITPENAETYAYFNLPSDANASSQGVAIGNDNGKIELRTTDQGTSNSYVWKFDNDGSLTTPGGYIKPDATDGFLTIEGPLYADMVQEEGGGVRTITNGVKIRTHRAFDDINRDWNFSWDGAIYAPRDASNDQVGAIEWRTGDVISQVRRTEGGTLLSGRVVPPGLMLFSNNTGGVSVQTGVGNYWTFEASGDLTLPGDIRSEGNINIDINLSDSTLHRWSFGEDGHLNLPSGGGNIQSDGTIQLITGSSTFTVTDDVFGFLNNKNGTIALSLVSGGVSIAGSGNFAFSGNAFAATTANNINFTSGSGITLNSPVTEVRGNNLNLVGNAVDIQSEGNINIDINLSDSTLRRWRFGEDGDLTFPDATVQTTAWTKRIVAVPTASTGASGDREGDLAFNATHQYYCTADYVASGTVYDATLSQNATNTTTFYILKTSTGGVRPQVGWILSFGGGDNNIVDVGENSTEWILTWDGGNSTGVAGSPISITTTALNIWKRIAWSGDTW